MIPLLPLYIDCKPFSLVPEHHLLLPSDLDLCGWVNETRDGIPGENSDRVAHNITQVKVLFFSFRGILLAAKLPRGLCEAIHVVVL